MQKTEFHFQPSKQYLLLVAILLIASGFIILFLSIHFLLKIALLILFMLYAKNVWQQSTLQNADAILRIKSIRDDQWLLHTNKMDYHATLRGDSTLTAYLCVLRFQIQDRCLSSIILRDSLGVADDYRRLLVQVRWQS